MEHKENLIAAIEAKAEATGYSTSSIAMMIGLGGKGYERIKSGGRVWPETAAKAQALLSDIGKKAGAA